VKKIIQDQKVDVSIRFAAWRCGGILAQQFNRITADEPCTNIS
jgi:hypothetical protein